MKPITITNGVFMTGITLRKECDWMLEVYSHGTYIGCLYTNEYRLNYSNTTSGTKYYTIERR